MTSLLMILFITLILIINLLATPLALGLSLLALALLATVTLAHSFSPLLSVILFLIYVGGIIIIFAYFIASAPRPNITNDAHLLKLTGGLIALLLPTTGSLLSHLSSLTIRTSPTLILLPFQTSQVATVILIILILLLAIIIIVKVATLTTSPLRPFK